MREDSSTVTQYSAYVLDPNQQVARVMMLDCASDEEAGQQAQALVELHPIELWNGKRRVGRFDPPPAPKTNGQVKGTLSEATALHKAGQFDEAGRRYEALLAADPHNPTVLTLLGTLNLHRAKFEEALRALDLSLGIDPNQPMALTLLGDALSKSKRYGEAVTAYEKSIALKPDRAASHSNLAGALLELNRPAEALASVDTALALQPNDPEAHYRRGSALRALRRNLEALASYDKAIELRPDYALAYVYRGLSLGGLNRSKEAGESLDKAIALDPNNPDAHRYGADLCRAAGQFAPALALYDNAIMLRPRDALTHHLRANVLRNLRRFDEALESSNKAVEVDPNLSFVLGERMVIQMNMCSWGDLRENRTQLLDAVGRGAMASVPFALFMVPSRPELHRACAELNIRERYAAPAGVSPIPSRSAGEKIRVAYVSADYHSHPVARHLVGLIENHDRTRFETIGVSLTADDGTDIRSRVRDAFDRFVEIHDKSDDEAAALLRDMEVDIAIDLMAFTSKCRPGIFARRAAPIQVNYLGYPGTMGADYIDYLIADKTIIPEQDHHCYSEKIVYLPDSYIPNDSKREIAEPQSRAKLGLPETGFVFASINNTYKITPELFDIWMRLLKGVDNSVLWLSMSNATAVRNLDREAEARGVSAKRLVFATYVPKSEDHLARLTRADLFLDTLPYNAHSTACEALWAGVPVLTCKGNTFAGRVAASLLNAVGLPELVTHSLAEYEDHALRLARDPVAFGAIKEKLARNRTTHPLFDTPRFSRHIEAAYTRMWERHQSGHSPAGFSVDAMSAR